MDEIADRVDGRCQMCGSPCDADFCCDGHFELWMAVRASRFAEVGAGLAAAAASLAPALNELGRVIRGVQRGLVEAGMVPGERPSDPKAAALHARRHRNTGPTVHADPRLNRRGRR